MANDKNIYFSLDEAREELKKRWNDKELKEKIEQELGDKFLLEFKNEPRGMIGRQLPSPDNGFVFFMYCASYINALPLAIEYLKDIFVSVSEEKKGLGRLRVTKDDGTRAVVDIVDFNANEKKRIDEVVLKTGEKMIDFHHNLLKISKYNVETKDLTEWIRNIGNGKAKDFYYFYLLHFIAHGVLFETFFDEGISNEDKFTHEVILPTIKKIEKKFGIKLLIIRLYPENQEDVEDFYWWSYPSVINDFILNYAKTHTLKIKNIE